MRRIVIGADRKCEDRAFTQEKTRSAGLRVLEFIFMGRNGA